MIPSGAARIEPDARQQTLQTAAKAFIWAFFLLVFSNALGIAAGKFGVLPGRPVYFYAIIASGLTVTAILLTAIRELRDDLLFFSLFLVLVVLGALMYSGNAGPDFGGRILVPMSIPSPAGYAIWPILNFMSAIALYLFARNEAYRATILHAAFATFLIQIATMEADMWWPAIFGDQNGRAGGLAQNANEAALIVTLLASLALPARPADKFSDLAIYIVMIAVAAVLLAQSKAGVLLAVALLAGFCVSKLLGSQGGRPRASFAIGYIAVLAGTILLSPVLNGTATYATRPGHVDLRHYNKPSTLDDPVSLSERIHSRASIDDSANYRREAFAFFFGILKERPAGLGTGFTNKFVTGPHNELLKLAVDNGLLAPLLFIAILVCGLCSSIKTRSPLLGSITVIIAIAAVLYHTLMPDPAVLTTLALGLGFARSATLPSPTQPGVPLSPTRRGVSIGSIRR
jgi:hypothetical protein